MSIFNTLSKSFIRTFDPQMRRIIKVYESGNLLESDSFGDERYEYKFKEKLADYLLDNGESALLLRYFIFTFDYEFVQNYDWSIEDIENYEPKFGNALLYAAAHGLHENALKHLISLGADFNKTTSDKLSLMHYACLGSYKEKFFFYLLGLGLSINDKDKYNMTPLDCAAVNSSVPLYVITKLYSLSSLDSLIDVDNILHHCAGRDDVTSDFINFFTEKGVDIDGKNKSGATPLEIAVCGQKISTAISFLKCGADFNYVFSRGCKIWELLVLNGKMNRAFLNELIELGLNVNAVDDKGNTLLHHEAALLDINSFGKLVKYYNDVFDYDKKTNYDIERFKMLIMLGVDYNKTTANGYSIIGLLKNYKKQKTSKSSYHISQVSGIHLRGVCTEYPKEYDEAIKLIELIMTKNVVINHGQYKISQELCNTLAYGFSNEYIFDTNISVDFSIASQSNIVADKIHNFINTKYILKSINKQPDKALAGSNIAVTLGFFAVAKSLNAEICSYLNDEKLSELTEFESLTKPYPNFSTKGIGNMKFELSDNYGDLDDSNFPLKDFFKDSFLLGIILATQFHKKYGNYGE